MVPLFLCRMSNKLPQRSPPLSPLQPPHIRRASAVSTTNSLQSELQLQEANSCSLTPIAQGAVALVNLPPPLPPKDEPPQLSPGVSDHAFLLDGKFKPLSSPLGTDGDVYVVEPVGAIGGRTLYKIAGDKDTVSSPMYLYDAILDEFVPSTKPRRFPTTLKKSGRGGGGVGRSLSVPLGKGLASQQEHVGLDRRGEGGSSSWLHIDVHKPIPIVENGPPSAISSKFTEGPLSTSTPVARGLVEASSGFSLLADICHHRLTLSSQLLILLRARGQFLEITLFMIFLFDNFCFLLLRMRLDYHWQLDTRLLYHVL